MSNWRKQAWRIAAAIVVLLLLFNPETISMALFVDAVGLDLLLLLIQVQIVFIARNLLLHRLQSMYTIMRHFCGSSYLQVKNQIAMSLSLSGPAMLMLSITAVIMLGSVYQYAFLTAL